MRQNRGPGFSLIELVVVIAISSVLVAMLLAAVQRVRAAAARAICGNNLKQVGLALLQYHDTRGQFPPGMSFRDGNSPQPFLSWNARILPFVEKADLWRQIESAYGLDKSFYAIPPHVNRATVVTVFACPSIERTVVAGGYGFKQKVAFTAYLGVSGLNYNTNDGVLYRDSETRVADILDGAANTLMVGERPPSPDERFGWWYAGEGQRQTGSAEMILGMREFNLVYPEYCWEGPYNFGPGSFGNSCDTFHFWSPHGHGAHFLFCDGSVRFIGYSADPIMPALATRSGGEAAALPD